MLNKFMKGNINFLESVTDWKEAITVAAQPLLKKGYITKQYIEAMIQNVIENGAYIVIMPNFAIPHAKPSCGVNETSLSLLKLKKPTIFPEQKEVKLIVVLASKAPDDHLDLIAELADILMEPEKVEQLFNSSNEKEVLEMFQ